MNRFRVNLHPLFSYNESGPSGDSYEAPKKVHVGGTPQENTIHVEGDPRTYIDNQGQQMFDYGSFTEADYNRTDNTHFAGELDKDVVVTGKGPKRTVNIPNVRDVLNDKDKIQLREVEVQTAQEAERQFAQSSEALNNLNFSVNNRSLATAERREKSKLRKSVESAQEEEKLTKKLGKLLLQLAKNKRLEKNGLNMSWTNEEWDCSKEEKKLGTATIKVFMELLSGSGKGRNKVKEIFSKCRLQNGPLDENTASQWKNALGINSKIEDIQSFHKSYMEYQSQTEFMHLKGLMGFLQFEAAEAAEKGGIEGIRDLIDRMDKDSSTRISRSERRDARQSLYDEKRVRGEDGREQYVYVNRRTGEVSYEKPNDMKQRSDFEVVRNRLEGSNKNPADKMLTLLCDFNLDGEVNSGDVGNRTGSQFAEVWVRERALSKHTTPDSDAPLKNLIAYAKKMNVLHDVNPNDPEAIKAADIKDAESLYKWMTDKHYGYENTRMLQGLIQSCPADFSDVLRNGENAGQETLNSLLKYEEQKGELENSEAMKELLERKTAEIMGQGKDKIEKMYGKKEGAAIMQQLMAQLPTALLEQARQVQSGMAIGKSVPLDQIINGLSAGFHLGVNDKGNPIFGVFLGWGKSIDLGKGADLTVGTGAGLNLGFIPCATVSTEIGKDVNRGKRNKTLDAVGVGRIHLGGNVMMIPGGIPGGWAAELGFDHDEMKGIEQGAVNIRNVVEEKVVGWLSKIIGEKADIRDILKAEFPGSSDKMLDEASRNLNMIFDTFNLEQYSREKGGEPSDMELVRYAKVVADTFAEQWLAKQTIGAADGKWKLTGASIGIADFAGTPPLLTAALKFSKYNNLRAEESERSIAQRVEAEYTGTYNRLIDSTEHAGEDSAKRREDKVDVLNGVVNSLSLGNSRELKDYDDTLRLMYETSGKEAQGIPGWIRVPKSLGEVMNIRVNREKLKSHVQIKEEKGKTYYLFPANAAFRILNEGGSDQKTFILNIGGDRNADNDVNILVDGDMKTLEGNKPLLNGKRFIEGNPEALKPEMKIDYKAAEILNLFDEGVINAIKTIDSDNNGRARFSEFVKNKTRATENTGNMIDAFLKVIEGSPKKTQDLLAGIKEKLSDPKVSIEDKVLIMDRVLAISANANVKDKTVLDALIGKRRSYYMGEKMIGSNGQAIFKNIDGKYRGLVQAEQPNGTFETPSTIMPNIIGATAFYHRSNAAKGLALTGLGVTSVLNGKVVEINDENDKNTVMDWFIGGKMHGTHYTEGQNGKLQETPVDDTEHVPGVLDKAPTEWNIMKKSVTNYIETSLKGKIKLQNSETLSDDQVKDLLRGKSVELSIDNYEGKGITETVRVKLDAKCVFYLMGECANESVGIQLGGLTVEEQTAVGENEGTYFGSTDARSNVSAKEHNARWGFTVSTKGEGQEGPKNTEINTQGKTKSTEGVTTNPSNTTETNTDTTPGKGTGVGNRGGRPGSNNN